MAASPSIPPTHLANPRPFSPGLLQRNNRSPALGSATQTLTNTPDRIESPEPLVLRLRGAHTPLSDSASDSTEGTQPRRNTRISWAEGVIDNEGLGRKKSKVCCIYHKPRPVGESSDESSSDSSSDSDSGSDVGRDGARPVGGRKTNSRGKGHKHNHDHSGEGDGYGHNHGQNRKPKAKRRPSPNAYERMPRYDVKPLSRQPGSGN